MANVYGMEDLNAKQRQEIQKELDVAHCRAKKKREAAEDADANAGSSSAKRVKTEKGKKKAAPKKKKKSDVEMVKHEVVPLTKEAKANAAIYEKYKKMTVSELKEYLRANEQLLMGKKLELVDRCVDGEVNGALGRCNLCGQGKLILETMSDAPVFMCKGYFDEEFDTAVRCNAIVDSSAVERSPWKEPGDVADHGAAKSKGKSEGGSASMLTDEQKSRMAEAASGPVKELATLLVQIAREAELSLLIDDQQARQAVGGILMSSKDDDGNIDTDAAWTELVTQFPSAKEKGGGEKSAKQPSARVAANTDLANLFCDIARVEKKLGGENVRFKVSGALAAANALRGLDFEVTSGKGIATGQKKLGFPKVKGVGKRSGEIIDEFLTNNTSSALAHLNAQLEAMGAA